MMRPTTNPKVDFRILDRKSNKSFHSVVFLNRKKINE